MSSRIYTVLFPSQYYGTEYNVRRDWHANELKDHLAAWNDYGWFVYIMPMLEVDGQLAEIPRGATLADVEELYDSMLVVEDGRP